MDIKDKYKAIFGERLNNLLAKKHVSNNELAKKLGIERSNITQYINGGTCPKLDIFLSICEILEVKPEYFLDDEIKFKDYYNLKSKSKERKIIESIFTLCAEGLLTQYNDPYGSHEYIWCFNQFDYSFLDKLIEQCDIHAKSEFLDTDIDFCEKIVNSYEKDLYDFFDRIKSEE